MYVTASLETREALSSGWQGMKVLYQRYDSLMDYGRQNLSAQEKRELDALQRDICLQEFDLVESPSLRIQKFVHIGDNSKRHECDALVNIARKSKPQLSALTGRFQCERIVPGERRIKLVMGGPMMVNHAGGIMENAGLCLHPHAGIPYIPGSAVKGVARHAMWCEWADAMDQDDHELAGSLALKIAAVFGFPSNDKSLDGFCEKQWPEKFGKDGRLATFAGLVAFMPAMPLEYVELVTDICNCHHADYYKGKQEPWDNERPNPQFFPAVEKNSMFEFVIRPVIRMKYALTGFPELSEEALLSFAEEAVRLAAEDFGFGSKTSNGYGWFYDDSQAVAQMELLQAEQLQERAKEAALEAMSDEEREVYNWKKLDDGEFSGLLNTLPDLSESQQRSLLEILFTERAALWNTLKKAKKGKQLARLEKVQAAGTLLGVTLP
ncbi:MAG: type III-B CRISPR module RAMP protein Cmr6 [Kiritimatiellia bacterium]